jgi:hypothetical protein
VTETIRGAVVDGFGQLVAGAVVQARRASFNGGLAPTRCTTDRDGRFELEVGRGTWSLQALGDTRCPGARVVVDAGAEDVVVVTGDGALIHGTVRESDGTPWTGTTISCMSVDVGDRRIPFHFSRDGGFAFDCLAAGRYRISAALGGADVIEEVVVGIDDVVEVVLGGPSSGPRHGTILGLPVASTRGDLLQIDPSGRVEKVGGLTLEDGAYNHPIAPDGEITLRIPSVFPVVLDDGDVHLPTGRVAGVVVRSDGGSLDGTRVRLTRRGSRPRELRSGLATTDESGAFEIVGVPAGTYDLFADTEDEARGSLDDLVLAEGDQRLDLVVAVDRGGVLEVIVLAPSGEPALPSLVWCEDLRGHAFPIEATGETGRHRQAGMGAGRYRLLAASPELGVSWESVHVARGETTRMATRVRGRTRFRIILLVDGIPAAGATVGILAGGRRVPDVSAPLVEGAALNLTDGEGILRTAPYPPGRYQILAWNEAGARAETEIVLDAGLPVAELLLELSSVR